MKKYSGCMCTFVVQIKTIKLFKYEKMQVNIVYLNYAHTGHFMSTPVFVALQLNS